MLVELAVEDLGVISRLSLVLGPGMTALTGETGAGKTLLVEAIELLVGGRADPVLVRPGAEEARIEGRFVVDGEEVVLARVIAREGRSRAYVNGRMATATASSEEGSRLVDLHGQHSHQSLLSAANQRAALDRFGAVDLEPLTEARREVRRIDDMLDALGGDERARAREIDLLRFQVAELDRAAVTDPQEDERLDAEEDRLGGAQAHREAATAAYERLSGDDAACDAVATALAAIAGRAPFAAQEERLRAVAAELGELASEIRAAGEAIEDDPQRLDAIRGRRHLLHELRRKYGDTLAEVIAFGDDARARLAELTSHDERAAELERQRQAALDLARQREGVVGRARRAAAPALAAAVEAHLHQLAMPRARLAVEVGDDPGDEVTFLLAANAGGAPLPLSKVASGGELARAMLALRLVLTDAPPTLVFDEVDAGIGGEAALAVGRALSELGRDHQVLVVTHLPQVAAFADAQVAVSKVESHGHTVATARTLDDADRVVELSRMLSGLAGSETARGHAEELLAAARQGKGR